MKMDIFIKNGVIKQREEVEQSIFKKNFDTDYSSNIPGPYYDPYHNHCHIWKPVSLIKNFKGEQNQTSEKYKKYKEQPSQRGLYCSICHIGLKSKGYDLKNVICIPSEPYFKKRKAEFDLSRMLDSVKITKTNNNLWDRLYIIVKTNHINKYKRLYSALIDIKKQKDRIVRKWEILCKKLLEPVVYYQLNAFNSIPVKLSEMTPFQKFKYNNPDYRKTTNFIIYSDKFTTNYVTIS